MSHAQRPAAAGRALSHGSQQTLRSGSATVPCRGLAGSGLVGTRRALPNSAVPAAGATPPHVVAGPQHVAVEPAALSRVLFTGVAPNQAMRAMLTRRPPMPRGPFSILLMLLSLASAIYAAVRRFIRSRTKQCSDCRGFGIRRCELCDGSGSIRWEAKWDHVEPCPRCTGHRFCGCSSCGGLYHRPMFRHISRNAGLNNALAQQQQTDSLEPLLD